MYIEYKYIYIYILLLIIVGLLLFGISFICVYQKPENGKIEAYECGFNPYSDARNKFEIKYYLIGILFIIFDLELVYLFPWIISIKWLKMKGIYCMLIFLWILTIGFGYEWLKGAIDWE